jgi:hypothetical protein
MYGIARFDVFRNQASTGWMIGKATVYSLSSALAGLTVGTVLGAAGSLLSLEVRLAIGSVLALLAIAAGSLELLGRRIQLPQLDCETPRHWVDKGALRWAIQNGLALGFGATSRIGFLLWYVVPLGALLSGGPVLGATIYGAYGLVRGVAAPLMMLVMVRRLKEVNFPRWLILHNTPARVLAARQLVLLGVTVVIVVGL